MTDYNELLLQQYELTAQKVDGELNSKLSTYCKHIFSSDEYYRLIRKHVTQNIISITNKSAWTDPFIHACSPYIKAIPLIRAPYSIKVYGDDTSFPVFSRTLNDLAMLIKRLQQANAPEIVVQDFGIFLYIMYSRHIKHLQDNLSMSYEQAIYSTQQVIRQFLCNISSLAELNHPRVTLVMHDSLGMFQFLMDWNKREHVNRMRFEPYYAEWSMQSIASFYSAICPMFRDYKTTNNGFLTPRVLFKRTEFLPKLDRMFINLYFNTYNDIRTAKSDEEFLTVLKSRDKNKFDKFAEQYFTWEDRRKLYCQARKRVRCFLNAPYEEPTIRVWRSSIHRSNKMCEFECYDPFEVDLTASQIFANTTINFKRLEELYAPITKQRLKEIYLMAQTINQVRRKYYGNEGDALFMSLNVDIINVPEDKREIVQEVVAQTNTNLESSYMDNFTFVIHEDFTGFTEYIKQPWYGKEKDNESE